MDDLRGLLGRGEYAEVERRARAQINSLTGRDATSVHAAEALDILVVALWRGGKASQQEAVEFAEQAIAIKETLLGPNDPALATSLDNAGVLFFVRADYERALRCYQRALAIWQSARARDAKYETDLGKVHSHLGPLFQELGQYSTARDHYERSLQVFLATLAPDDSQIAMSKNNLATLMTRIGDYEEALKLYQEALATLERRLGPEHPLIANGTHNLAELNQRLGRYDAAVDLYRKSAALKEKALGAAHPSLALTLGNLSYLYSDRGEAEPAATLAARALEIHEAAYGRGHVELAYSLISVGRAQTARSDTDAALAALSRALELRGEALGKHNPLLVPPMHFMSQAYLAAGKPREAFAMGMRAEEIGRAHLRLTARGAPERQALRYAAERLSSLDRVLWIAADLGEPALVRQSWDALIQSRAVVLDEMATRHRLVARQENAAMRDAFEHYGTAAERLSNMLLRGPGNDDVAVYGRRISTLRAEEEAAERALAAQSETLRRGLAEQKIRYDEVRAALPRNSTLVSFARIERDARSTQYVAFVLDDPNASPRLVSLGPAREIETAIRRWRDELTPEALGGEPLRYRQLGARLRELLWDPLRVDASANRLVLMVPAGAVHLVNFAALSLADGTFLAESEVLIHSLSSERDVIVGEPPAASRQLLVVGGVNARPRAAASACTLLSAANFPRLPGAAREARRIASIWKSAGHTTVELLEDSATETAFKRHAQNKSVVHLATHGFFLANECMTEPVDTRSPLRLSGLMFAADSAQDGILLADEVATMDFTGAQWVVLSGCDTGIGQIQIDEGIVGLRRAFHVAGARTLVMTLWPVEDQSAEAFMGSLYQARLHGGQSTAASMRRAYRDALATTRRVHGHRHPLYWAPFIASGDWR